MRIISTISTIISLTLSMQGIAQQNADITFINKDQNYDIYINGVVGNRSGIVNAPVFNNVLLQPGDSKDGPLRFSDEYSWVGYTFNPYCGNVPSEDAVRVVLRANLNGRCNGQDDTQNPPTTYINRFHGTGLGVCVEVSGPQYATISSRGATQNNVPAVVMELDYNSDFKPQGASGVAHLCKNGGGDMCLQFSNHSNNNVFVKGTTHLSTIENDAFNQKVRLTPNSVMSTDVILKHGLKRMNQRVSGTFPIHNNCSTEPAGSIKFTTMPNGGGCGPGGIRFRLPSTTSKKGPTVLACAYKINNPGVDDQFFNNEVSIGRTPYSGDKGGAIIYVDIK